MAERIPDNPAGKDFEKMPDSGQKYRAIQNVGLHPAGTKGLIARDFGPGGQIQRLLNEGLIVREGDSDPKPEPQAKGPERVPPQFRPEHPETEDRGSIHSANPRPVDSGIVVKPSPPPPTKK